MKYIVHEISMCPQDNQVEMDDFRIASPNYNLDDFQRR